ncbi:hypothetical protein ACP70R_035028 [Stipagrostis hirtigluma subsp. patula]
MDGSSRLPSFQSGGTARERSCGSLLHRDQDMAISSQVQEQLNQIYVLLDMEQHEHAVPAPSWSSSTLRSFSRSPHESSSLMLAVPSTKTSCPNPAEVSSSLQAPLSPISYGNLEEVIFQEVHPEQARCRSGQAGGGGGAFRPYVRHLGPRKKPKTGASGQKAIKTAMSVLERIHMARLAEWRCYQMETMAATPVAGSSVNQLQHVLSERKRREKLNDSFKALKAVLPPAAKKDKASILIRARDYVNTLKLRVAKLEEKNRMLEESHHRHDDNNDSDEHIEVDICRTAGEGTLENSQEFHLKMVLRSGCNSMDAVVDTLQCLKEIGDVRLVAMGTGSSSSSNGPSPGKALLKAHI